MPLLKLSTAALAPLAAAVVMLPSAHATFIRHGQQPKAVGSAGAEKPAGNPAGAPRPGQEPFAIRFSGIAPKDYGIFASKEVGAREFTLLKTTLAGGLKANAEPTRADAFDWWLNEFSEDLAQPAKKHVQKGKPHGAHGKGHAYAYGKGDSHDKGHSAEGSGPSQPAPECELPPAPPDVFAPVPEPNTALFGAALLGVCGIARSRTRQKPAALPASA